MYKDLAVIVPIYKKEAVVVHSLTRLLSVLDYSGLQFEVIAVVDGSPDMSFKLAKTVSHPNLTLVNLKNNQGKGAAVRKGMKLAQSRYIGVLDCGLDIDARSLKRFFPYIKSQKFPVLTGSKFAKNTNYETNWKRWLISRSFIWIRKALFNTGVSDTQIGIKFYKQELIKPLLRHLQEDRWLWDLEIYTWVDYLGIQNIKELPVIINLNNKLETSESAKLSSIIGIFWGMYKLSLRIGKLSILINKDNWNSITSIIKRINLTSK